MMDYLLTSPGVRLAQEENALFHRMIMEQRPASGSHPGAMCLSAPHPKKGLYVISDGMGDDHTSEIASRICVDVFQMYEDRLLAEREPDDELICAAVQAISIRLHTFCVEHPEAVGLGASFVLCLVGEESFTIAHLGDSRAYFFDGSSLRQLTADHSSKGKREDQGIWKSDQLCSFTCGNSQPYRYLGADMPADIEPEIHRYALKDGLIFLTTNRLTDFVSNREIESVFYDCILKQAYHSVLPTLADRIRFSTNQDHMTMVMIPCLQQDWESAFPD